jgi:hypothetical protein
MNSRELLPGVTMVSLDNPAELHNTIAAATGEPTVNTGRVQSCQDAIEQIVDAHGVSNTLRFLAEVCADKAGHILDNWQDEKTAKAWAQASKRLDAYAAQQVFHKISIG